MEATYLGDIELTDETLEHYGVKGMKWRHRKGTVTSAMANDPRYQVGYIVKPGEERDRLNKLNPAGSRAKPVTTTTTVNKSSSSSSSSSSKKGKGGSKKAVKDLLSRFKLTKGGSKSSSDTKTGSTKGTSEKKESSSSRSSSSTTKKESSTSSRVEEKKTEEVKLTDEQKKKMEETATKNQALLDSKRAKISAQELDLAKKRKKGDVKKWVRNNSGARKLYPRS